MSLGKSLNFCASVFSSVKWRILIGSAFYLDWTLFAFCCEGELCSGSELPIWVCNARRCGWGLHPWQVRVFLPCGEIPMQSPPVGWESAGGQRKNSKRTQMVRLDTSGSNRTLPTEISKSSLVLGALSVTSPGPSQ